MKVDRVRSCLTAEAFLRSTFTPAERRRAGGARDPGLAYASLFAAKEAVYKALHLAPGEVNAWAVVGIVDGPRGLTARFDGQPVNVDITYPSIPGDHILCVALSREVPGP